MQGTKIAESDQPLEAVLIERKKIAQGKNPNVELGDFVVLKRGPMAHKVASHWIIVDRNTGEMHHHAVNIETFRRYKAGWTWDEQHSITLEDTDGPETKTLATFLYTVLGVDFPSDPGNYLVVPFEKNGSGHTSLQQLLSSVSNDSKANFVMEALSMAKGDPEALHALVAKAAETPEASKNAAATLNAANFTVALDELQSLIDNDVNEPKFQSLLAQNAWMFGSEYSELLTERIWCKSQQQDFMLRCTTDGYLEIVEIKTTLSGKALFVPDPSHDTFYPRSELSAVLGQVMQYIEDLDGDRHRIKSKDNEDVAKIRGKIIIGRDGDAEQQAALRRLNGHLHRVEIITFDQLVKTAKQVLRYLSATVE